MSILITGATGFVGKNLIKYLNDVVDHQSITRDELYNISVASIKNNDAIIHLAGKAHDLKRSSNPDEYYQVNYELTKKLYDAFLLSNANKFIFISSVKAAADEVDGILTEDTPPNPQTDYGKSKLMAEQYIQSQHLPSGKSYYILRPCMIHGPGNKGNLNLLYKFVKKGIPYPLASFSNQRSFLAVENLCFVILELINSSDIPSGIYQVADDEAISTNDLIKLMYAAIGKKAKLWHIPTKLISSIAKIGDNIKMPLNTERLKKMTESYVVANTKIKNALLKELPVKVEDGIIKTIKAFDR